jgi:hypothetical protein
VASLCAFAIFQAGVKLSKGQMASSLTGSFEEPGLDPFALCTPAHVTIN